MNFRFRTLFFLSLVVIAAVALYMVKYRVQGIQEEIALLQHQIEEERQATHILSAEWAYLNHPDRLQKLNDKYLAAEPMSGEQMIDLVALPYPAPPEAPKDALAANTPPAGIQPVSATGGMLNDE